MIDIHSHLLPGVDDGSKSLEQTLGVLERFVAQGVTAVVLTPHLKASSAHQAPVAEFRRKFAEVQHAAPAGIALHLGWEVMLDVPGADLTGEGLALGSSDAVLVEFSRHGLPPNHLEEIFRIRMSGRVPVVAHPERYPGCTPATVESWKRSGAVIQLDAAAPLMRDSKQGLALSLLQEGLVDLMAADNHGDGNSLAPAYTWLSEAGYPEEAALLTEVNAGRVLASTAPLPVPPVRVRSSMLQRLRDLVFGRGGK